MRTLVNKRRLPANMASRIVVSGTRQVKPILSLDKTEARRRVLNLYKAWYRHIPHMVLNFDLPVSKKEYQDRLRELFKKNEHVKDLRAIDLLVVKGQIDLVETIQIWKQRTHIMRFFNDTHNPKPTNFLDKFYEGNN